MFNCLHSRIKNSEFNTIENSKLFFAEISMQENGHIVMSETLKITDKSTGAQTTESHLAFSV